MDQAPSILYHYVSVSGLHRIITSGKLSATDLRYMNDAQEMVYSADKVIEALDTKIKAIAEEPKDPAAAYGGTRFDAKVLDGIAALLEGGASNSNSTRAYATCFSSEPDMLSQWRAYANDDGYAIGFNTFKLTKGMIGHPGTTDLVKIRYGESEASPLLEKMLANVGGSYFMHQQAAYGQYMTVVLPTISQIKHPSFQEEKEWRILCVDTDVNQVLKFRPGKYGIIPYIDISYPPDSVAEIWIGPGNNNSIKQYAIQALCRTHLNQQPELKYSQSSLRV